MNCKSLLLRSSIRTGLAAVIGLFASSATLLGQAATQSILTGGPEDAFIVRPYAARVVRLHVPSRRVVWERKVGARPHFIQRLRRDEEDALLVSCELDSAIWMLDAESGNVIRRIPVGPTPWGFDVLEGRYLVVALHSVHQAAVWDLDSGALLRRVATDRFPSAVRVSQVRGELYVAHFYDGDIEVFSTSGWMRISRIQGEPTSNQVSTLLLLSRNGRLMVPHNRSNSHLPDPRFVNAVLPAVSVVDLERREYDRARKLRLSFLGQPVNGPEALALFRGGKALISVNSRSNDLSLIDLEKGILIREIEVGAFPLGIHVGRRGRTAWIANSHEHTLSVIDLVDWTEKDRIPYGEEPLDPQVARGRDLFHDADSARMARNQWLSCSNCHPRGLSDGRTWKLPGKPRLRTKTLRGGGSTLPAGWLADRDEMQDEEIFIREFMQGTGLSPTPPHPRMGRPNRALSPDLDALSAYLLWLKIDPSPFAGDEASRARISRGRELFRSKRLACETCHPGPAYTISSLEANPRLPAVTEPGGESGMLLDVPSLLGLHSQPSYLHHGRAATLSDVFRRWGHGNAGSLSEGQLQDLEAFLLSLPEEPRQDLPSASETSDPLDRRP